MLCKIVSRPISIGGPSFFPSREGSVYFLCVGMITYFYFHKVDFIL